LVYLYTTVLKQSFESIYATEHENFKWILEPKECPTIFKELQKEQFENLNFDDLILEKLEKNRDLDEKNNDLKNSFENYFNSKNKEQNSNSRKEFFIGRTLSLEKSFLYFPELFKYYHDTLEVLMMDNNGSLPIAWRYYIAIMVNKS
jgi:hypothetical protein